MANPTVPASHPRLVRLDPPSRREPSFGLIAGVLAVIRMWWARRRGRQELQELAERGEDHLLEDIGMTRDDALRVAGKWFWQR